MGNCRIISGIISPSGKMKYYLTRRTNDLIIIIKLNNLSALFCYFDKIYITKYITKLHNNSIFRKILKIQFSPILIVK